MQRSPRLLRPGGARLARWLRTAPVCALTLAASCASAGYAGDTWEPAARALSYGPLGEAAAVPAVPIDPALSSRAVAASGKKESRLRPPALSEGYLVGFAGSFASVEGEFDGETVLVGPNDLLAIPELDESAGYRALLGYRWRRHSFEVNVHMTEHDGDFAGFPLDTNALSINVDFKEFWRVESRLQPYVLLGAGLARAEIEDGATDGMSLGDAELSGYQLNAGGGFALHVFDHLFIDLQGVYRLVTYTDAEGINDDMSIDDDFDGDGWYVSGGLTLVL